MNIYKTALLAGLVAVAGGPALAGPLLDAATTAEQRAAAGDATAARDIMRNAIGEFSASLPLAVGKAVFVSADPAGYGMYEPRPTNAFKPGEKIVSYVEPVGLTWKPSTVPGKMEAHFTIDFDVLDTSGTVRGSQKAFGKFDFTGFGRNQEIYTTLTIDLSDAPVGDYVLRFHFNDINSGRTASVDQPFAIAAAAAPTQPAPVAPPPAQAP